MAKRELTCAGCGKTFTMEADYFEPGICGYVVNTYGKRIMFVDPEEPHYCDDCCYYFMDEMYKKFKEELDKQCRE